MSGDTLPLDFTAGQRLRAEGVARVTANHPTLFQRLLAEAKRCSRIFGEVHNDALRAYGERHGIAIPKNLYGAVWRQRGWREIGRRASTHPGCHSHRSGVYVWVGGAV